jgi:hypothetical protein
MIRPHGLIIDIQNFERQLACKESYINIIESLEKILDADFDSLYFTEHEVSKIKEKIEFVDMLLLLEALSVVAKEFQKIRQEILGGILVRHLRFASRLLKIDSNYNDIGTLYDLPDLVKSKIVDEIVTCL